MLTQSGRTISTTRTYPSFRIGSLSFSAPCLNMYANVFEYLTSSLSLSSPRSLGRGTSGCGSDSGSAGSAFALMVICSNLSSMSSTCPVGFEAGTGVEGASSDGETILAFPALARAALRGVAVGVSGSAFLRSRRVHRGGAIEAASTLSPPIVAPALSNFSSSALVR